MKLSQLVESLMAEVGSEAAEQAKALNLVYKGYGRWADQSGKIVAKTVDGKLVKLEPTDVEPGAANPEAPGAEPMDKEPIEQSPEADSYINPEPEISPDMEPEKPAKDTGLERLLAAAGGDSMKVRKALVKKLRAGDERAKVLLSRLDQYDAEQKASLQQSIDNVAQRKAADLAAKKAKYAQKYPSPQV